MRGGRGASCRDGLHLRLAPILGCAVHAATKAARKAMWEAYGWFVAAFRDAADKLKVGDRNAAFPAGSFPPGLPFVVA
jgi:hypothetical protein